MAAAMLRGCTTRSAARPHSTAAPVGNRGPRARRMVQVVLPVRVDGKVCLRRTASFELDRIGSARSLRCGENTTRPKWKVVLGLAHPEHCACSYATKMMVDGLRILENAEILQHSSIVLEAGRRGAAGSNSETSPRQNSYSGHTSSTQHDARRTCNAPFTLRSNVSLIRTCEEVPREVSRLPALPRCTVRSRLGAGLQHHDALTVLGSMWCARASDQ